MSKKIVSVETGSRDYIAINTRFQIALVEFQEHGGEYGVALAMLNAAYGKGKGAVLGVPEGQKGNAPSPLSNDVVGLEAAADKASKIVPTTSTQQEVGLARDADKAVVAMPTSVSKKPGHAKRGATAIASVQATVSKSLFDSIVLPDGRKLREVHWAECPRLAKQYRRVSRILMAIHSQGTPADPSAKVSDIVTEEKLNEIVSAVEKFNDIH